MTTTIKNSAKWNRQSKDTAIRRFHFGSLVVIICLLLAWIYPAKATTREHNNVISVLKAAMSESKANFALSFYLGQMYYQKGDMENAISTWEQYLALAPEDSKSVAVRERLTILKIQEAEKFAQKAIHKKQNRARPPQNTMAVLELTAKGAPKETAFVKGLTAMVITDLSKVPGLTIVERVKISALFNEMALAGYGIVNPKNAAHMGRMLMARKIIWGDVNFGSNERLSVTANISDSLRALTIGKVKTKGEKNSFFKIEKKIVLKILKSLNFSEKKLGPAVMASILKVATKSAQALTYYGQGLIHLDRKEFTKAKTAFGKAMQADPGFKIAVEAFQATPISSQTIAGEMPNFKAYSQYLEIDAKKALKIITRMTKKNENKKIGQINSEQEASEILRTMKTDVVPAIPFDVPIPTIPTIPVTPTTPTTPSLPSPPTNQLGYAVAMVDQIPGAGADPLFNGTYSNSAAEDMNGTSIILNGSGTDSILLDGASDQIVNYFPPSGDTSLGNLPYKVSFTPLSNTSYMEWGYWQGTGPNIIGLSEYAINSKGYYINGDPTQAAEMSTLAAENLTATYSGNAYGTMWSSTGGIDMTGAFSADVSFQDGQINNFSLNVSDGGTNSAGIANGTGSFTSGSDFTISGGNWNVTSAVNGGPLTPINQYARGAVYGPNAENIGGIFSMQSQLGDNVNGAFEGAR